MTIEDTLSTITPNNANSNSNSVDIISYFHQIHDSTYKKLFRHKLIIEELFTYYISKDECGLVDLSSLQREYTEFDNQKLTKTHADLIWKFDTSFKDTKKLLYLLTEFQSTIDPIMIYRMLGLIILVSISMNRANKFDVQDKPLFLPLVIYNDEKRWDAITSFKDPVLDALQYPYNYTFSYKVIDIGRLIEADLDNDSILSMFFRMERAKTWKQMEDIIQELNAKYSDSAYLEIVDAFFHWFLNVGLKRLSIVTSSMIDKVKSLKEVGNMLEINAPHWLDATRQEGYDAGSSNREREIALNLKNMGLSSEQISKATGLAFSDIENLKPNTEYARD